MGFYYCTVLLVLLLDQGTKLLVQKHLALFQTVPVIPRVFSLTHIINYGAAFGILRYQTTFLVALTLLVIGIAFFYRKQIKDQPKYIRFGLALGLGGALGNLIDRFRLGGVVDFLDLHFWPIFNFADIAIVFGVAIIVLLTIRHEWLEKRKRGMD